MRLLSFILLLLPGLAFAQQPIQFDLGPTGPVRYTTQEVTSVRFLGEEVQGPVFKSGERLEILTEKEGWVRVRLGERYGWVPSDLLAEEPPADDSEAEQPE